MKGFYCVLFVMILLIGTTGCGNKQQLEKESSNKQTTIPTQKDYSSSDTKTDNFPSFTDSEISNAKKVAEKHYKENLNINIESLEYDLSNFLYSDYSPKYDKNCLITFTVKEKDSVNPPRGIVLARKDLKSEWYVVGEGF